MVWYVAMVVGRYVADVQGRRSDGVHGVAQGTFGGGATVQSIRDWFTNGACRLICERFPWASCRPVALD